MKALSLFGVFVIAKTATLIGRDIAWSGSAPAVYFWQDAIVALLFAAMFMVIRNSRLQWALYVAAVLYIGLNTILVHVLSTPLTVPMFRAARGALADSILHYATWQNARLFMLTLAAGAFFPLLFHRIPAVALRIVPVVALVFAGVGWNNAATADTAGLERNALAALALSAWPRLDAEKGTADWRQSPFSIAHAESLAEFSGAATGRNVVLVVLESTGARHLKTYGAGLDPMPNLNRLANEAILFENAYAVYPESIKALLPALCSRYPAFDLSAETHARTSTASVARVLSEDGYRTALFHSGRFIYLGMQSIVDGRGFALTEDAGDIGGNVNSSFGVDEPATIARILNWIDQLASGERFFLTYLPIAGHHPYETPDPRPFPENTDIDRYRNALFAGDHALGVFLDELKKRGLYEKTLFVVYGDHGEAFGEHEGNFGHTMFIFEENVRVPYLIALPGMIRAPRRVARVASVIDTAPTILDLLGLPAPAGYQGASLLETRERMALLFTDYSLRFIGLRDGPWKFIDELGANRPKLFRLDRDPDERENLAAQYPERTDRYRQHLISWGRAQKELILSGR